MERASSLFLSYSLSLLLSVSLPLSVSLCLSFSLSLSLSYSLSSVSFCGREWRSQVAGSRDMCVAGQQTGPASPTETRDCHCSPTEEQKKPNIVAGTP